MNYEKAVPDLLAEAINQKQLDLFLNEYLNNIIEVANIKYRIDKGELNRFGVPTITLVNFSTGVVHHVPLALINVDYVNYLDLSTTKRLELIEELDIVI